MPVSNRTTESKQCGRCKEIKPLQSFGRVNGKERSYCRVCHKSGCLIPDMRSEKQCTNCKKVKAVGEFTRQGQRYYSICKECTSIRTNLQRAEERDVGLNVEINRDNYRKYRKWLSLKSKYGLSKDQYEAMVLAQGNKCAICKKEETEKDGQRGTVLDLSVDHCHKTGRVRGLLCRQCNIALGRFQESIDALKAAIAYLEQYKER